MNDLQKAFDELDNLVNGLGLDTSNTHGVFRAVLANLHVRLKNLETAALPVVEQAAEQIAVDAVESAVK